MENVLLTSRHSELSARDGYFIFGLSLGRYGGESEVDALAVAAAVDLGEIVAGARPIPDLVARDFTAQVPGAKMVGDITYIPAWEGWLFLATVIDCAPRKVVGWAMDDNYRAPLITSAIKMAARNLSLPADAVFDSDYAEVDVKPENLRMACSGPVC